MKTYKLILTVAIAFGLSAGAFAQDGQQIFKQHCAVCHSIGQGRRVGPDLKGVESIRSTAWLMKWIKSSQTLVKAHDKQAEEIFNQFKIPMPDQALSKDQIKSILAYIKQQSEGKAKPAATTATASAAPIIDNNVPGSPTASPDKGAPVYNEKANKAEDHPNLLGYSNNAVIYWMCGIVGAVVLITFIVLSNSIRTLSTTIQEYSMKNNR